MKSSITGWFRRALVLVVFLVGLGLRLYDLDDAPLDFHATRQLHSAMIARGMFYQDRPGLQPWKQAMAVQQWRSEGQIEPPVMENLAQWGYRLAGEAYLWIPRLWAIAFWMAGSVFIYLLARDLSGPPAALAALSIFLVWPYGVIASRSFQPEPLQVALITAGLWAAFRWDAARQLANQGPGRGVFSRLAPDELWAALTGLLAGLAIFVKLTSVFLLGPALAALVLKNILQSRPRRPDGRRHISDLLKNRGLWLMAGLAVLPAAVYLLDGLWGSGFLRGQVSERFYPNMWLDPAFYLRWISVLERMVPFNLMLVALLGCLLFGDRQRPALLALWGGYLLYGFVLPHHISTHDYYHLVMMVPLSLGLGAAAGLLHAHLRGPRRLVNVAAVLTLVAALVLTGYGVRNQLKRSDYRAQVMLWQSVGAWLGPDAKTVALVDDYGGQLKYWGWINPLIWPTADDMRWQAENGNQETFAERFERLAEGQDYFLVSPLAELEQQPELAQALNRYSLVYQASDLRIYDLRQN